ncbi:hypothetical protein Dimus_004278 [Dionaea muscipula]
MEEDPRKGEGCNNLLDLIPKGSSEWLLKRDDQRRSHGSSDEKKLELRLGPPGDEAIWSNKGNPNKERDESLLSLGYSSSMTHTNNHHQRNSSPWPSPCPGYHHQQQQSAKVSFLQQYQTGPGASVAMESLHSCCTRVVELQNADMKAFSPTSARTAVPNSTSQKRAAPAAAVVGWPPLRSFRKNLASSSSCGKTSPEPQGTSTKTITDEKKLIENGRKGMFVKINMDGVPIGRKVDLHAYDNYDKLSIAVDELFRGLLAAQKDQSSSGKQKEDEKPITGLLDAKAEYTLVYEDNEGDRMLVGDVPWQTTLSHLMLSTLGINNIT